MTYPGQYGTVGPLKGQYSTPHVYARDVFSGSGNCVCGSAPQDRPHIPSPLAPAISERALEWLRRSTQSLWPCQTRDEHQWFDRDTHQQSWLHDWECRKCGIADSVMNPPGIKTIRKKHVEETEALWWNGSNVEEAIDFLNRWDVLNPQHSCFSCRTNIAHDDCISSLNCFQNAMPTNFGDQGWLIAVEKMTVSIISDEAFYRNYEVLASGSH